MQQWKREINNDGHYSMHILVDCCKCVWDVSKLILKIDIFLVMYKNFFWSGGGVIKQFMDNSCIYKINIPSLYSQYIGIKYFIPDLPLNILWLLMNLMMESWFSKWAWNLRQWKRSRCTLYLYKAFYFYEKLDNPVLCKDATHSFMIISDQNIPILCMMTLISLSLFYLSHGLWHFWFLP